MASSADCSAVRTLLADGWWRPAVFDAGGTIASSDGAAVRPRSDDGRPRWARFAADALADPSRAPDDEDDRAVGADDSLDPAGDPAERAAAERAFAPVVRRFADRALRDEGLHLLGAGLLEAGAYREIRAHVVGVLTRIAARVLVAEVHRYGVAADAAADRDDIPRPDDFHGIVQGLAQPARTAQLITRYPVLARLLADAACSRVAAVREMLDRLAADLPQIAATLLAGVDPGPVTGVEPGAGDAHAGGRTVTIVHFASHRLVYKPRAVDGSGPLRALLAAIAERVPDLDQRLPLVLARNGYGWYEFIDADGCPDAAAVSRFYLRTGGLLAVLHVLRTTDMHCENLLAAGEHPVLVDLETVQAPELTDGADDVDPARRWWRGSVLRTAMLPMHRPGPDVSGLGGEPAGVGDPTGGVPGGVKSVAWAEAGTMSMHLVRTVATFTGARNRPRVGGVHARAERHVADLVRGFVAGYDALLASRAGLLCPGGVLDELSQVPVRVLARDSQVYARLLDECTHPSVLMNASARLAVLRRLAVVGGSHDPRLVTAEVAQLDAGDVPLLICDGDGVEVHDPDGAVVLRARRSGAAAVRTTLLRLSAADRARQVWTIEAALGCRRPLIRTTATTRPLGVPGEVPVLTGAIAIGDRLLATAVHDGRRANWVGLYRHQDGAASVLPMGADLADGYLGVALFLAELAAVTGSVRHARLASAALVKLPDLIDAMAGDAAATAAVGAGLWHGAGGLALGTSAVHDLMPDCVPAATVDTAVDLTVAAALAGGTPERGGAVAGGRVGGLLALVAVARRGGAGSVHAAAGIEDVAGALVADRLRAGQRSAAGDVGLAWSLARTARFTADDAMLAMARGLLEACFADAATHDDLTGSTWTAALAAGECLPGSFLARRARGQVLGARREGDDSLSGGVAGRLATALLLGDEPSRGAGGELAAAGPTGLRCSAAGSPATPGFLHGLAGIGWTLLRLHDRRRVRSLLDAERVPNEVAARCKTL